MIHKIAVSLLMLAAAPALLAKPTTPDPTAALYKSKCQMCHAADGTGNTPTGKKLGAKAFQAPEVVKLSDAELFDITKKGKEKMPAYDKKLTDDQIKALVKYIRTLKSAPAPPKASPKKKK